MTNPNDDRALFPLLYSELWTTAAAILNEILSKNNAIREFCTAHDNVLDDMQPPLLPYKSKQNSLLVGCNSKLIFHYFSNLIMLSLDRTNSVFGKLYKSVANFSTSPFCCNASHKHWIWSVLKSNCWRPKSELNKLLPFVNWSFGDKSAGANFIHCCDWFSFSRFDIELMIRWFSICLHKNLF